MIARSRSRSLLSARTVSFKARGVALPAPWRPRDEPGAQPRERDVGIDLLQADLDMPPADPPAAGDVIGVVGAGQELADPLHERALEPVDLGLPARDDLAGRRGAARSRRRSRRPESWRQGSRSGGGRSDPLGVGVGPTHVRLELAITAKQPICVHFGLSGNLTTKKNPRPAVWRLRGHTKPFRRPFMSNRVMMTTVYMPNMQMGSGTPKVRLKIFQTELDSQVDQVMIVDACS